MENTKYIKWSLWLLFFALLWSIITYLVMNNRLKTYESALNNTVDATIMDIDNVKLQIKARNTANDKDRQMICNKLIPKLKNNVPQKYIEDGTCEL